MLDQETSRYEPIEDIDAVLPILSHISILAGLSKEQLDSLFKLMQTAHYNRGDAIFRQGKQPTHIYIVKSGSVKLVVSKDDTPFELVVFGQGQCFGESSVIGIRPHAATAFAMEDTELVVLSRTALMSLYDSDIYLFSTLMLNIARESCRRLHASSETMLHYFLNKKPH
jgi:CRP-like cAMP-binding protein